MKTLTSPQVTTLINLASNQANSISILLAELQELDKDLSSQPLSSQTKVLAIKKKLNKLRSTINLLKD